MDAPNWSGGAADDGPPPFDWDGLERCQPGQADPQPMAAPTQPRRFVAEDADFVCHREGDWRVKGLWPRVGLCWVFGPSMSRKTFWVMNQASRIALGETVLGRRSIRAGVVYVAAEGANGVRTRFQGLLTRVGPWGGMIRVIGAAPNLRNKGDVAALRAELVLVKSEMTAGGHHLGVVVIDTMSASIPGADENAAADMSLVLNTLQEMARDLEVCCIVVAHVGKNADRGLRGWSGLLANADGAISLQAADTDGITEGAIVKVKDGEAGETFAFGLEQVDLGLDADGDPITTCVVRECGLPERPTTARATKVDVDSEMVMKAYDRMVDAGETAALPALPGVRPGDAGVLVSGLRARTYSLGLREPERPTEDAPAVERRRWAAARKKAYQRSVDKLILSRQLRMEGEWIWAV